jgi:hypothetical protein
VTEPAEPAVPEPEPPRRGHRWRWVGLAVAIILALCVGVPVGYLVWPIVAGTVTADHGEGSPGAALLAFVFTFEDGPDATGVDRLIVPERRGLFGQQRRAYIAAMQADQETTGWAGTFRGRH